MIILKALLYSQGFEIQNVKTFREGSSGVTTGFIKSIAVSKDSIWFATARGVLRFNKNKSSFKSYTKANSGLVDNYITDIGIDGNNVWFTTSNGLSVYNISNNSWRTFRKSKTGLSDNYLTCVLVDGTNIWIGTRTWGLNKYDKETNEFTKYGEIDGLNSNSVTSIAKSGRHIWVGTEAGLNRYDIYSGSWAAYGKEQGLTLPKLRINSILPEGNSIWVGTIAGVYRFDTNDEKFIKHSLSTVIFDIVMDGSFLWVATFDGLYRVNKETQSYKLFTKQNGLIDNSINCIAMNSNFLWLGTESPGGGVMRIDKQLPEVSISQKTGYTKKNVISIYGTVQDSGGIRSYSLSYRSLLIGGPWKTESIRSAKRSGNVVQGLLGRLIIDPKKFNEETYEIKLTAISNRGKKNTVTYNVIVDKTDPKISIISVPRAVSKSTYLLEGRFQEANMSSIWIQQGRVRKKAKIKLSGLGGIGTLGGGKFSYILQLRRGKNVVKIIARDIGKHEVVKTLEINYDTDKPVVRFEKTEITTSERIYKIIGTINEQNLEKVILAQGNITLYPGDFDGFTMEKKGPATYKFIYQVTLKPGENKYTIIAQDYSDKRGRTTITVNYKTDAPKIAFDEKILTKVKTEEFKVYGTWEDNDLTLIEITNATSGKKIKAKIDKGNKTFEAVIKLKPGQNIISAAAIDNAGNVSTITMRDPVKYLTEYKPDEVKQIAISEGDSPEIRKIKQELNKLRKENAKLKVRIAQLEKSGGRGGGTVVFRRSQGQRVPIPRGNALYFVPYNLSRGDRLTKLAKDYLGSSRNYGEIAYFNDNSNAALIKTRKSLLMPTKELLRMIYSDSRPVLLRKAADIIGEAFNILGPGNASSRYYKEIYKRFVRRFGSGVRNLGYVMYSRQIAIGISGMVDISRMKQIMMEKNVKTGLFVVFTKNSVIYNKIIIK